MTYQRPSSAQERMEDYEAVLKEALTKPDDMVSYYAFHGVKSEISTAIGWLKRMLISEQASQRQAEYLQKLIKIDNEYKWDY